LKLFQKTISGNCRRIKLHFPLIPLIPQIFQKLFELCCRWQKEQVLRSDKIFFEVQGNYGIKKKMQYGLKKRLFDPARITQYPVIYIF